MEELCATSASTFLADMTNPPTNNLLLAALPAADYERLLPHLELEPGSRMRHVFFPTHGIVSLLYVMENGASAEIAITGNDGLVGIALFMGGESTPSRAVVQAAGHAYRLPAQFLRREFERGGELQHLLLRFTQALITQMAQTAVCNRHQELIANMLGVRREGVTEAAGDLQDAGLIKYRRGHITVLDRRKLERRVCECYAVVKRESERLLSRAAR